jgi:hypothetical protein
VLATPSADEIGADALLAAGIADVVHWPIIATEIAMAFDRCLAVKRVKAKAPVISGRQTCSTADSI